jgi:hypothetical protein
VSLSSISRSAFAFAETAIVRETAWQAADREKNAIFWAVDKILSRPPLPLLVKWCAQVRVID